MRVQTDASICVQQFFLRCFSVCVFTRAQLFASREFQLETAFAAKGLFRKWRDEERG